MHDGKFAAVLSQEAAAFIFSLPKPKQRKIFGCLDRLAFAPSELRDVTMIDASGRFVESALIEAFLFTYWIDHAVCEVRITEIHEV